MNNGVIILAGGAGEQFKSKKPKALREVLFRPVLDWVIRAVQDSGIEDICVITGAEDVIGEHLSGSDIHIRQSLTQATDFITGHSGANIVLLGGDTPFIDKDTIENALKMHAENGNAVTAISENAVGYCFNADILAEVITELSRKEYTLQDVLTVIADGNGKTGVFVSVNEKLCLTADTGRQLNRLNELARREILEKLMDEGVDIPCADGIIIGPDCKIGADTVILPNTIIRGNVTIGEDCVIGPNSYIENATIGNGVKFNNGQIRNAKIMNNADIGPFVQIRPDSLVGENVHLGNFVEVKNSVIDTDTKVSHLTYVGDSDVGKNVNFGCGVVTVNFNGKTKHRTVIGDGAFIGCNTNLVAPVTVGENSYTAAGSTITKDVPDNSLAIARERQTNKEGWVKEHQPYRKKV